MGLILRRLFLVLYLVLSGATILKAHDTPKSTEADYFLFPRIGVAKAAAAPVLQTADNSYNVTYTITVKNYGDEILSNVQVTHLVLVEYPTGVVTRVGNVVATGSLIANNNFGGLDANLLGAGSKLYQGEQQTIVYTLNVKPALDFGPFVGTVLASATGTLLPVTDLSVNGTNPDPNGDTIPLETSLTSVTFTPVPVIGVAKSVSSPIHQADGSENITYTITVKNLGNEKLNNVQITDVLSAVFIPPATFSVIGSPVGSGTLSANASFNGTGITNLLAPGSSLGVGQTQTVTFSVNIKPNALFGPFENNAIATADGSLAPAIDISVNGNNPDPNGDGLPLEFSPTPVTLIPTPIIGLAKSASTPLKQPDNSYNITYTLTLENLGNINLTNVQVTDVLTSVFTGGAQYAVVGATVASGTLIAKVGYDGSAVNNLLSTGSTLAVGATQTITFTVNVKPNGVLGPYLNTALASATGGIIPVTDASVDGNDPDPNGDGLPLEVFPTLSLLIPSPIIGISKSASAPILQPDGQTYNITYKITLENLGNENLTDVRVTDALISAFVAPSVYSLVGGVVTSGSLVANAGFNGNLVTDLLGPGSTLAVGATQTITFTVNVNANGLFAPYLNTAVATAMGSLLPTTDISVDGNDPDPNGDGLPLETFPTTTILQAIPIIGVSKSASTPVLQPDGSYNIPFTITVENLGNEPLINVQVTDVLANVFIAPSIFSIVGNVVTSGTLSANAGFNGGVSTGLLSPGSTLAIGATQTINFTVNVKANSLFGPFLNTVVATANGSLLPTVDISVDGNDPDPNGDGLPLETFPTTVNLIPFPLIGVAKSASSPILQADGSYLVTFTITLENLGNEALHNVQVTDALVSVFGSNVYSMVGGVVANGTLIANAGFNGNLVSTLLAPGSTLAVGATQTINFTVKLKPDLLFGPFLNQAIATATGSILPTTDLSVDGNNPDPNSDGLPLETSPTAVLLVPVPVIGLAKSASAPLRQPDFSYNITYTFTLKNLGNVRLENVQITDVMSSIFVLPSTYTILGSTVASGTLISNPTFDGDLSTNLLSGGSTLEVGATQTVQVTINVKPAGLLGPYINTAVATATGLLLPTMDISMDGNDPDPNGDGLPLETLPTIVSLVAEPVIGLSKNITSTILQADGSYNVTYDLHVRNYGNVSLHNVFITDNLSSIFGLAAGISLVGTVSTTGGLSANVAFNGYLDINLLDGALSSLPIGGSESITYTINVRPGGVFGPYCNTAFATATGPGGIGLTLDISHLGTNPDPNGNGKPNESGENECTPVIITPNPVIGVAKAASVPTLQANGSYNVTYSILVKNIGNSPLSDVQVTDDLALTFPSAVTVTMVGSVSTTGTLIANTGYNGKLEKNLLAPTSTLAIGSSGTITFTVNMASTNAFGPFYNTAVASGRSGTQVTSDISTSGTDPDPNNNGNPGDPGESATTSISLAPNPIIGVAKAASSPLFRDADDSYDVTFTFTIANLGNVDLENVQVTDNLLAAFPSPTVVSIVGNISTAGTLLPNTAFNGASNVNLLSSGSLLPVGAVERITLTLNIVPNGSFGPFFNTATGSAKAVGSTATTSDVSTGGNNPDPNGNNNPGDAGENTTTSISLTPYPLIGVAKSSGAPSLQTNGSYNVPFTISVTNMGNVGLTDVQVTDNLSSVIGTPATFTLVGPPAVTGALIANGAFNGSTDANLLAVGSQLAVGATSTINFTVNVVPNSYFGPFSNSATGSGRGVALGVVTTDISCNGSNPDPNGNGNPGDPGENTATTVTLTPNAAFGLAMNASAPQLQADGTYRVTFTIYIKNLGNVIFDNLQVNKNLKAALGTGATYTLVSTPTASGTLMVNPVFNGDTETKLLSTGQKLAIGATETITVQAAIRPVSSFGPFPTSATATAASTVGTFADISAPGTNPDLNDNGNPADPGENDPTMISLAPHPVLGVAQSATSALLPDGTYRINFLVTIRNMGNIDLTGVQVTSNLAQAFPLPATFTMNGGVTATGTLAGNPLFNGATNVNLLSAGTLPIGGVQLISYSIIADGHGILGPYFSNVNASGTGGTFTYHDISTNGINPDPNNNGSPGDAGEDAPTVINLTPSIVAGISKAVTLVQIQPAGSYRVTYTLYVKNLGNTAINNLRVTDVLSAAFPAPATFTIVSGSPITTGQLIANANYNGRDVPELLAPGSKLAIGATHSISLTVDVTLNGGPGIFYNSATLTAIGDDASLTFADISAPGSDPDPNGNGNPGDPGENSPTAVTLSPKAVVGLAKTASLPRRQADGSFLVTYTLTIKNMGNVTLTDVQIEDDLAVAFTSPVTYSVSNLQASAGLSVNTSFNTPGNRNLLAAGNQLAAGATATVSFNVRIIPGNNKGPFLNSAKATANGSGGTGFTSDLSANGTDPDPNANGNPSDPGEDGATPLVLILNPVIGVAKSVAPPVLVPADNSYDVTYTLTIKNLGDVPLYNVGLYDNMALAFPSPATITIKGNPTVTGTTLQPNPTYDGDLQFNLLNANSILGIGRTETVTVTVNVQTPPSDLIYYNSAVVAGSNEENTLTYTDISTVGSDPDPNGNGNPNDANENAPTPVILKLLPVLGLADYATKPVMKSDGTYDFDLIITVSNLGNEDIKNVKVSTSLRNTFPSPMAFKLISPPVATGNLTLNNSFNGNTVTELISNGTLAYGETRTITLKVNVTAANLFGVFWNYAWGTGFGVTTSQQTSDTSNDGLSPDPARSGQPDQFSLNQLTPIDLDPNETIGVSNTVSRIEPINSCEYLVILQVVVENFGNARLSNVKVRDDLSQILAGNSTYTIQSVVASGGIVLNPDFNGNTDRELLAAGNTLDPLESATITLLLHITPNLQYGPYENRVDADGQGPERIVNDLAANSEVPDPDNNRIPDEESVTEIKITPVGLYIPEGFSPNGDGTNDQFIITLECGISAEINIFNRWGDKVFYQANYQNDWDGVSNDGSFLGRPLPEGTYFYQINLSSGDKISSYITLKR